MLKSTHKPSGLPAGPPSLPDGWTEHKAPTGHSYYYHAATKKSTYSRPVEPSPAAPPAKPSQSFLQYQAIAAPVPGQAPPFFTPNAHPDNHHSSRELPGGRGGFQNSRGGHGNSNRSHESRPQPADKPTSRTPIPGCAPWELVETKYGRRFVYNTEKDQSFWRIPDKLKEGILALDQERIKRKAEALSLAKESQDDMVQGPAERPGAAVRDAEPKGGNAAEYSSEYEEVEVTDDEHDEENPAKRQRTEQGEDDAPVEFNEDDIAFQLAAMGQDYGLDPGEYDDGNMEEWEEGAEGLVLSHEDAALLFKDLLNDMGISPYSPWEKTIEDGKLVDDTRYTALTNMKSRREVWEEWSREKIKHLRELKAKEEKRDPTMPFLAFLQKHATPKLYWPEFKRKFRKEPEMRDIAIADKDREKFYREHVNRLKMPQSTLKADLTTLLKTQTLSVLNKSTLTDHLPAKILGDIRYISLEPSIRDPIVEAYLSTLPPPPENLDEEESSEAINVRKERERRQLALQDREKKVAEEKRRQRRNLEFGKGRLREEEEEIARAMNVTKKGLKDQLRAAEVVENSGS